MIDELKNYFFQGYEWESQILSRQVGHVDELCYDLAALLLTKRRVIAGEREREANFLLKDKLKNKLINWISKW